MEVAMKWEGTVMEGEGSGGDSEMGRNSDGRRREWRWQ